MSRTAVRSGGRCRPTAWRLRWRRAPCLVVMTLAHREVPTLRASGEPFVLERSAEVLRVAGDLRMEDAGEIWSELRRLTRQDKQGALAIDLSGVRAVDGGVMALLVALRSDLAAKRVRTELVNAPANLAPLVELYGGNDPPALRKKRRPEGVIAQVGRATVEGLVGLRNVVTFFGEMVVSFVGLVRRPRSGHWKEVPHLIERTGADAIPIVVLINFLVGFVMAYQAANQLRMFGANLYVADLVGLSMTRELAPLMTAIIVCGRSGAAIAAEIGTMKVSEEVDALRTIGLRPFAWLVVPRAIALVIVVPILVVIGDIVGILGGLFVGVTSLDLTANGYLIETQKAMEPWDVQHGLVKSVAFAVAIVLVSCQQGFAASGGAESVGRRTTSTVVISLFTLVLLDATFTVVFRILGR